eukprot:NODE_85_length_22318_cov_0.288492.p14 type:complete len:171 gc:universal NODE_85_length_22318_cov_0.288492:21617-22129(+)
MRKRLFMFTGSFEINMQLLLVLIVALTSGSESENTSLLNRDDLLALSTNPSLTSRYQSDMATNGTLSDATISSIKAETTKNNIHLVRSSQQRTPDPRMQLLTAEDFANIVADPVLHTRYIVDISNYGTLFDDTFSNIFSKREQASNTTDSTAALTALSFYLAAVTALTFQ